MGRFGIIRYQTPLFPQELIITDLVETPYIMAKNNSFKFIRYPIESGKDVN